MDLKPREHIAVDVGAIGTGSPAVSAIPLQIQTHRAAVASRFTQSAASYAPKNVAMKAAPSTARPRSRA